MADRYPDWWVDDLQVTATAAHRVAFEGSIPVAGGAGLVVLDSVSVVAVAPGGNGNGRITNRQISAIFAVCAASSVASGDGK